MQKYGIRRRCVAAVDVPVGVTHCGVDDVTEQLLAQVLQKIVLGLKMRVKRGAADIGCVDDLLYGDPVIRPLFKQARECAEYGVSRFSLASVHAFLHTNSKKCSVRYIDFDLTVDFCAVMRYNDTVQDVRYQIYYTEYQAICQVGETV